MSSWWVGLCALTLACVEPVATRHREARLATNHVWAGGTIEIVSPDFRATLPALIIATDTVLGVRVNDSTLRATVPQLHAGTYAVQIRGAGFDVTFDGLVVHGLIDVLTEPQVDWFPVQWPSPATPTLLTNQGNHLALVDLRFGTSHVFPDSVHDPACATGPGVSYLPDRIVLAHRNASSVCDLDVWSLTDDLQLSRVDTALGGGGSISAEINPSVRVFASSHTLTTSGGTSSFDARYEETRAIRVCAGADVATIVAAGTPSGLPFIDGATGAPRFVVNELVSGGGAAFTVGCDTGYVVGRKATGAITENLLVQLQSGSGQRIRVDTVPMFAQDLALEATGRWVLIVGQLASGRKAVLVLDRGSLQIQGRIELPLDQVLCDYWLVRSDSDGRLYVFANCGDTPLTKAYRIDIAMP